MAEVSAKLEVLSSPSRSRQADPAFRAKLSDINSFDSDDDVPLSKLTSKKEAAPEDDRDDDMPLSKLAAKKKAPGVAKIESDSEDDVPLSVLKAKKAPPKKAPADAASDSDDDVPLSVLKARAPPAKAKAKAANKSAAAAKKSKSPAKKAAPKSKAKAAPSKRKREEAAAAAGGSSSKKRSKAAASSSQSRKAAGGKKLTVSGASTAEDSTKYRTVTQLLLRWQYALQWQPKELSKEELPSIYHIPLPGYPGVYVGTQGDVIGSMLDVRPEEGRPCRSNLLAKPMEELLLLLTTAVEGQMAALSEAEGEDSPLLRPLASLVTETKKVNASSAEKQWAKLGRNW